MTVGQQRIDGYADAVSDHNWILCDVPRATAAFGSTIAHGLLTLSMAPPLAQTLIVIDGVEGGGEEKPAIAADWLFILLSQASKLATQARLGVE